jgi:7-cyano-7-deazaguanine reductase
LKRSEIGIVDAALPFVGEDLWNAYELSWLNPKGKPGSMGCFTVAIERQNLWR